LRPSDWSSWRCFVCGALLAEIGRSGIVSLDANADAEVPLCAESDGPISGKLGS